MVAVINAFPEYKFEFGKSYYKNEDVNEGGYVYAQPGIYEDVALLDVTSLHPTSIVLLNLFGPYTKNFEDLLQARIAIKNGNYKAAREMLGGKLAPYLKDEKDAKDLAYALKIVINIVYGLTSAKFDTPFRDLRNKDNIVAKRGALFMVDLKEHVQALNYVVVHIKTDSIKIANADKFIIDEVSKFGEKYGYNFEHEATYDRLALVNDAVYIARKAECLSDCWVAVGAQFQHPYVFKTLFSGEEVEFNDLCETKQVMKGSIHLRLGDELRFIGRIGRFVPVEEGCGGGTLLRVHEGKEYAVTGTKGYLWKEANMFQEGVDNIDFKYFEKLGDDAVKAINKYGDFNEFIGEIRTDDRSSL